MIQKALGNILYISRSYSTFQRSFAEGTELQPSQITLISAFTIGIPAFLLSQVPDHYMIKGNFAKNLEKALNTLKGLVG